VQSRIARSRAPIPIRAAAVHEDHVIEQIDRLEAENERRIAVLFEDDRGRDRRFEAVRRAVRTTPRKLRSVSPPFSVL
jgi:hypothetical protein